MKKTLYSFAIAAMCALLLGSCVKDKGHYDYSELDAPLWNELGTTGFSVNTGDNLDITPTITTTHPESGNTFTYNWYRQLTATTYEKLEQTGPTLQLRSITRADKYLLILKNDQTGMLYKCPQLFTVSFIDIGRTGWIYLVQKGADVELETMISPTANAKPKWFLMKDLIENTADKTKQLQYKDRTAVRLLAVNNDFKAPNVGAPYTIPKNAMFMVTDKSAEKFVQATFETAGAFKNIIAPTSYYLDGEDVVPSRLVISGMGSGSTCENTMAFYWKGNWFWNNMQSNAMMPFENAVNIPPSAFLKPLGSELAVSGEHVAIMQKARTMVMWSEARGQFLVKTGYTGPSYSSQSYSGVLSSKWLTDATSSDTEIKVNSDVDSEDFSVQVAGRKLVHLSARNGVNMTNPEFYAIVEDPDGYHFLGFAVTGGGLVTRRDEHKFPANSNIAKAKWYATFQGYLYYATSDNKVWAFSLNGTEGEVEVTSASENQDLVPAGEEIVMFKSFSSEFGNTMAGTGNTDIHIITRNPSKPENESCTHSVWFRSTPEPALKLRTYTAAAMPDVAEPEKDIPMRFTGLGHVVDFACDAI